jgi:hypothetical protein
MHAVVVVVTVLLVVVVVVAAGLLLRSIVASPKQEYRRSVKDIREIREDIRAAHPDAAKISVDPDDWMGTTTNLGG